MKLIDVWRDIERYTAPDGTVNRIYVFLRMELWRRWIWSWKRWRYDGLPRLTIHAGPLYINCGKDHVWVDADA